MNKCEICKTTQPLGKLYRWDKEVTRGNPEHNEKRICSKCYVELQDKIHEDNNQKIN